MEHLKDYAINKMIEKDIESLIQVDESISDLTDNIKYKFKEKKRKWNRFWDWVFGDNNNSEYNQFSDNYDDQKLSDLLKKEGDTLADCIITWIKVDREYDINRKRIDKMLENSDESSDKNFWRTKYILNKYKLKPNLCSFVMGKVEIKASSGKYTNISILIAIYSKKIISIDITKNYQNIINWYDIKSYISSKKFKKGLFDNNVDIEITLHKDFFKKARNVFKDLKVDPETDLYKCTLSNDISESIDVENLAWKVDKYFGKKTAQYNQFVKLVEKFKEQHTISDEDIQEFLDKSKVDLKKFIDFICEDIDTAEQRDYMYLLRKAIQNILDDKTITL